MASCGDVNEMPNMFDIRRACTARSFVVLALKMASIVILMVFRRFRPFDFGFTISLSDLDCCTGSGTAGFGFRSRSFIRSNTSTGPVCGFGDFGLRGCRGARGGFGTIGVVPGSGSGYFLGRPRLRLTTISEEPGILLSVVGSVLSFTFGTMSDVDAIGVDVIRADAIGVDDKYVGLRIRGEPPDRGGISGVMNISRKNSSSSSFSDIKCLSFLLLSLSSIVVTGDGHPDKLNRDVCVDIVFVST